MENCMNDNHSHKPISSSDELLFSVFCIESVAERLRIPGGDAYRKLMQGNIINGYIVPYFDVLHTQGKQYITDDLVRLMRHEGVIP